jgi:hypothetical protein
MKQTKQGNGHNKHFKWKLKLVNSLNKFTYKQCTVVSNIITCITLL